MESRRLTPVAVETTVIFARLAELAVPMDNREFARNEYNRAFPSGMVTTPIETVKLGGHQFEKLKRRGRANLLGAMRQTLSDPIVIIEENDGEKAAHLYIKSFKKDKQEDYSTVVSVVVAIESQNVVISTYKRKKREVKNKIKKAGRLLYVKEGAGSRTNGD